MWVWISNVEHPSEVLPNSFFDINYRLWYVALPFRKITLYSEVFKNHIKIGTLALEIRPWWFWGYQTFGLTASIKIKSFFKILAGYL